MGRKIAFELLHSIDNTLFIDAPVAGTLRIDGFFDVLERENLTKPQNAEDSFQGKRDFSGEPEWVKSPLLYLLS
jgi:hypothetical protein